MTVTGITTNQLEGQLGVSSAAGQKMLAIIGPSTKGSVDTLVSLARASDVIAQYGYGPMPQAACYAIEHYGRPVLLGKVAASTVGTAGAVDSTGKTGTSVVTVDVAGDKPTDDFEVWLSVVLGGTIGTGPITIKFSLDAGRSYMPAVSLGVANTYTILYPDGESTGVVIDFAVGTLVTGDVVKFTTVAPACTASDLTAILLALKNTTQQYECVCLASAGDATIATALGAFVTGCRAVGRYPWWFISALLMTDAHTDATYQTAAIAAFSSFAGTTGLISAGSVRLQSSVPQAAYVHIRPPSWGLAPLIVSLPIQVSPGQPIASHVIPGVSVADSNGNVAHRCHDESLYPGLDDAGFTAVRTWPRTPGTWCNLPRVHSASGSDFDIVPKVRIWNRLAEALYDYFKLQIQAPIFVNSATGFILETEASRIEKSAANAATQALGAAVGPGGVSVVVSRTDNLLTASVPTLTVTAVVVPPGYPQRITLNMGFAVAITPAT